MTPARSARVQIHRAQATGKDAVTLTRAERDAVRDRIRAGKIGTLTVR